MPDGTLPLDHRALTNKRRRWPWALGLTIVLLAHVTFFLPFRALVPIPAQADPWWGMALVLGDEALSVWLISRAVTRLRARITRDTVSNDASD